MAINSARNAFLTLAVKRLFGKIERREECTTGGSPQLERELRGIRFDRAGEPIHETINSDVRDFALQLIMDDLETTAEERIDNSPVSETLGDPVTVTKEVLDGCFAKKSFSKLALNLYMESVRLLDISSRVQVQYTHEEKGLPRDQAICVGLLVRIVKFMTAVADLVSQKSDRADVVFGLNRSILESATNLRFLLLKNEDRFFDQFVRYSLSPEREQYDLINENISNREGEILPIEKRMLSNIKRVSQLSGVDISEVSPRMADWGGGLRNRLIALGEGEMYAGQQRLLSHAVHGTWVDLIQHHLAETGKGFQPDPTWSRVDCRLILPICLLTLVAAEDYLDAFFPPMPELDPLLERIEDLTQRILVVDQAHEEWFGQQRQPDTDQSRDS